MIALIALTSFIWVHDPRYPQLDKWYDGLKRPGATGTAWGTTSCCSKKDCHTTEAELRGNEWWARVGVPRGDVWELKDWVKIPAGVVLEKHDNPTGEAVICHSLVWGMSLPGQKQELNASKVTVWCFVPPTES